MKKQTGYILCALGVLALLGAIGLLLLSFAGFGMDIESRVICAGLALVVFQGEYAACRKGRSLIAGEKRKDTFPADWAFAEKSKCEGAAEHKEEPVEEMPITSSVAQIEENDMTSDNEDPQDRIRQWFSYEMLDNGIDTEKQKEITSNLYIYHSKANGYKLVRDGDLVLFQTEDEDTFLDKLAEVAKKLKDFPPRSWKGSKLVRTLKNENGKSICIVRNETHSFVMIEESYTLDKGLRTAADCNNCRVYCVPTSQIDEITAENWWKFAAVVPTYKSFNASPGQGAR